MIHNEYSLHFLNHVLNQPEVSLLYLNRSSSVKRMLSIQMKITYRMCNVDIYQFHFGLAGICTMYECNALLLLILIKKYKDVFPRLFKLLLFI